MMRRIASALCAVAVACASMGTPSIAVAAPTTQSVAHERAWQNYVASLRNKYRGKDLRLIMVNDPFVPAFNRVIGDFEKLTGATLHVDTFGYDATYQKEVLACDQHDASYDLTVFDIPWTERFAGCTDDLHDRMKTASPALLDYDDFFPVMRTAVDWHGAIVGFPFAPYFVLQTYNKGYYTKLGLKPATTLDEMEHNAARATRPPSLPHVYGISMNNQAGSAVGQAFFEYIYSQPGGKAFTSLYPGSPSPYANMTPLFASKQGLAVVDMFKRLLASEPPGALNTAWTQRQSAFATGHIAMVNEWDVTTPSLSDPTQSTVADDFATAPFPTNGKLTTQVGGWSMGINRYSTRKELAWDFITWFTSAETSVAFSKAGGFPARDSVLARPELLAQYPWYATLRRVVPTSFADCRPRIRESFSIINTLGTYIAQALDGSMSSRDAMLKADAEVGALLKKAGYRVDALDR